MRDSTTRFRSTIEKQNNIRTTVNSLFEQLDNRMETKTDCDTQERTERRNKQRNQQHSIQMLLESICTEAGMNQEDINKYVSKAFNSSSNKVTIEINYGGFGRIGIDVSEGQTDVFSSTYDNYMFSLPKGAHDDSVDDLKDEIDSRSVTHDGVGFALLINGRKNKLTVRAHVFDRPNEILLQRNQSTSLIRSIFGI